MIIISNNNSYHYRNFLNEGRSPLIRIIFKKEILFVCDIFSPNYLNRKQSNFFITLHCFPLYLLTYLKIHNKKLELFQKVRTKSFSVVQHSKKIISHFSSSKTINNTIWCLCNKLNNILKSIFNGKHIYIYIFLFLTFFSLTFSFLIFHIYIYMHTYLHTQFLALCITK